MVVKMLFYLVLSLYVTKCYIYLANIFQQNHYDPKKYFLSLKIFYTKKRYQYFYYWGILAMLLSICDVVFVYFTIGFLIIAFFIKNHYVIKLKKTPRLIRLTITSYFLIIILNVLVNKYLLFNYLTVCLFPFIILIAYFINMPVEALIKNHFKQKAIKKIRNLPLIKVGITGSFGKTSTKNIITEMLEAKYLTLKTPKSYNTMMGLSLTINNMLNSETEIMVCEMGAFRKGEIAEMAKAIRPNIALICEIGMQHLATFKSIDQIVKAKFEITKYLKEDDILILNYDNDYISSYDLSNVLTKHIYTYGINKGTYHIKDLVFKENVTSFKIYKDDLFLVDITTHLLGRHNVINLLASFVCLEALKNFNIEISMSSFKQKSLLLQPFLHRLSFEKIDNINLYDDSYSSNIVGATSACEVLSRQKGLKVIITPGIVDGGKYDEEINKKFAGIIKDVFDEIYLIDNPSSLIIKKVLDEYQKPYHYFSSFKKAYLTIMSKYNKSEEIINLLIENDLPDSFLER